MLLASIISVSAISFSVAQSILPNIKVDEKNKNTGVYLLSSDVAKTEIIFLPGLINVNSVTTQNGNQSVISLDKGFPMLKKGCPDLPKLTTDISIGNQSENAIEIVSSDFYELNNFEIAPSKGTLSRSVDPSTIPYEFGDVYNTNEFFPNQIATLSNPFIIRNLRGATVNVFPFQYNAVTKVLRVYTSIVVAIKQVSATGGVNPLINNSSMEKVETDFNYLYKNKFINYTNNERYTPLEEQGSMLIICGSSYMNTILPFVNWKKQKGIEVTLVDVATVGNNAAAIKTYVANFYNNNPTFTFLLLIGDDAQVKTSSTGAGDSDNDYTYIVGTDHYPDIFSGRFSAETIAELQTQVDRSISYEKNPVPGVWHKTGIGIGSQYGGSGSGYHDLADWDHERHIRSELLNYTYSSVAELYEGSRGGMDAPGDPVAANLTNALNAGASVINYTGHGNITTIATTNFYNNDVANLSNDNMLPFVWIVGCQVGNFKTNYCFSEAWMRHTHNGNSIGAIANMGSTINQSWDEPMAAQIEFNRLLTDSLPLNIKHTFGGISFNGLMFMNDVYGSSGDNMTDTWTLFGDPSIVVRTDDPGAMTVMHASTIPIGSNNFSVSCNIEGALVCLSMNNNILATAYINSGVANFNFTALSVVDTILVTATAYNKETYQGNVVIIVPSGPWVLASGAIVHDASGNNNSLADYAENIQLEVALNNVGVATANAVSATLSTADTYITINNATNNSYGNIASGATVSIANSFDITVANNIPHGHVVNFTLTAQDNNSNTWTSNFSISVLAPKFANSVLVSINDASGNNNGRIDAGESVFVTIQSQNIGGSNSPSATSQLNFTSPYLTNNTGNFNAGVVNAAGNVVSTFMLTAAGSCPHNLFVPMTFSINGGAYSDQKMIQQPLNLIIEDWENASSFNWVTSGTANWFITPTLPYDGAYCMESGNIGNNQSTTLQLTLNVIAPDSIIFYKRVDSEAGWDFLHFYENTTEKNKWSGSVPWSRESFGVPGTGNVVLKWTYDKDVAASTGLDAAWLDDIILPQYTAGIMVNEIPVENNSVNAFPNPFSTKTQISFMLSKNMNVSVAIYNSIGQQVSELMNNVPEEKGIHQLDFSPANLSAGLYYCVLNLGGEIFTQKLVVQ